MIQAGHRVAEDLLLCGKGPGGLVQWSEHEPAACPGWNSNSLLGCINKSIAADQGKWLPLFALFVRLHLQYYGHFCALWYKKSSTSKLKQWQRATNTVGGGNTRPERRGWGSWPCWVWKIDGLGGLNSSLPIPLRISPGEGARLLKVVDCGRSRGNRHKLKLEVQTGCKEKLFHREASHGAGCPERLCSHSSSLESFPGPNPEQPDLTSGLACFGLKGGPSKVPSNLNHSPLYKLNYSLVLNIGMKPGIFPKNRFQFKDSLQGFTQDSVAEVSWRVLNNSN